jgi:hypothetical protein
MNILIDQGSVAIFFGDFELTDTNVQFLSGGVNNDYSTANASVIDADAPYPALSHVWKWENDAWVCIDQPTVDAWLQGQKDAFNESQKKKREAAYTVESDPIYFLSQRGEATQQEWLDKIAAIKTRFPYQE